jgi:hypothetical protein
MSSSHSDLADGRVASSPGQISRVVVARLQGRKWTPVRLACLAILGVWSYAVGYGEIVETSTR